MSTLIRKKILRKKTVDRPICEEKETQGEKRDKEE